MHAASAIAIATAYSSACLLLGYAIIPKSQVSGKTHLLGTLTGAFLLGECVFSALWLALGLAGQFSKPLIVSTLVIAAAASLPLLPKKLLFARGAPSIVVHRKPLGVIWYVLCAITLLWAVKLFCATLNLQPQGDAELFYMVIAKIMASSHRLMPQPNYLSTSQLGLFGELHYAALMSISGLKAAKLITWFTAVAATLMVVALCEEAKVGTKGKIVAIMLVMTSSAFSNRIMDGKVDVYGAALGLAAYYWALREHGRHSNRDYALSGIFCGFAIVAKLTNLPVIVPGLLLVIIINRFAQTKECSTTLRLRSALAVKDIAILVCMVCVGMVPHFVKNAMLFHEPFAPFFFMHNHGTDWASGSYLSARDTAFLLATYPIALTFGHYSTQWGTISPLVLGFVPLSFFLPRNGALLGSRLLRMSLAAAAGVVCWMAFQPSFIAPRYILATLLLFIPLAAKAVENMLESEKQPRICSAAVFGALVTLSLIPLYPQVKGPINQIIAKRAPVFSAEQMGIYYDGLEVVNETAAMGDRVLLFGCYAFYLRPDLLQCLLSDSEANNLLPDCRRNEIDWRYAILRGCKYVIIQKPIWPKIEAKIAASKLPRWLHLVKLFDDPNQAIYSVVVTDTTIIADVVTRQIHAPAWDVLPITKQVN